MRKVSARTVPEAHMSISRAQLSGVEHISEEAEALGAALGLGGGSSGGGCGQHETQETGQRSFAQ
jgi:hypothetical protein